MLVGQFTVAPPIPFLRPFDSAQGERNTLPRDGFPIGVGNDGKEGRE